MHKTLLLCFIHGFKVIRLPYYLFRHSLIESRAVMTLLADSQASHSDLFLSVMREDGRKVSSTLHFIACLEIYSSASSSSSSPSLPYDWNPC